MKPNAEFASDGRVNPKGIPCLYLAMQRDTAISEVRPWIGAKVTVAQFETLKPLSIIDCASDEPRNPLYMGEPEPIKREEAVWATINKSLSEPIQGEDIQRYVPTQILTEMFKMNGMDGIAYRSNFGDKGINMALFDIDAARLINRQLFKVKKIQITSEEEDNMV